MKRKVLVAILAAALLMAAVTTAFGDTITGASPLSHDVAVTAIVSPKLTLTIDAADHAKTLTAEPGVPDSATVFVWIQSNKAVTLTANWDVDPSAIGLTSVLQGLGAGGAALTKGDGDPAGANKATCQYTDTLDLDPTWEADANTYNYTLTYTATQ